MNNCLTLSLILALNIIRKVKVAEMIKMMFTQNRESESGNSEVL